MYEAFVSDPAAKPWAAEVLYNSWRPARTGRAARGIDDSSQSSRQDVSVLSTVLDSPSPPRRMNREITITTPTDVDESQQTGPTPKGLTLSPLAMNSDSIATVESDV